VKPCQVKYFKWLLKVIKGLINDTKALMQAAGCLATSSSKRNYDNYWALYFVHALNHITIIFSQLATTNVSFFLEPSLT